MIDAFGVQASVWSLSPERAKYDSPGRSPGSMIAIAQALKERDMNLRKNIIGRWKKYKKENIEDLSHSMFSGGEKTLSLVLSAAE
jgi:hypothetical protein